MMLLLQAPKTLPVSCHAEGDSSPGPGEAGLARPVPAGERAGAQPLSSAAGEGSKLPRALEMMPVQVLIPAQW